MEIIVVEKPMALCLEDADRMIDECKSRSINLLVISKIDLIADCQIKRALDSERFGKLVMATVRVRWCRDQSYYDQDEWRGKWSMDGGALTPSKSPLRYDPMDDGSVEKVYGMGATQLVDIEAEDTAVASLRFKNGALGVVEVTTATRPSDQKVRFQPGEFGLVEVGGFAMNEIKVWKFAEETDADSDVQEIIQ